MANIIVCMFVVDVVLVFVTFICVSFYTVYRIITHKNGRDEAPATMSSGLRVKSKVTNQIFDVYDTRHENGKAGLMIYKDNEFQWVTATEYEPAK